MIEFLGYVIAPSGFDRNKFWIAFPSGEGMEISKERLAEWMDRIYKEDF